MIATILLTWYFIVLAIALTGFLSIVFHYASRSHYLQGTSPLLPSPHLEPVLILRPCKGLDPGLEECLLLAFQLEYPHHLVEIIFCVASEHDAAVPVINRLMAAHPHHDTRLVVGELPAGPLLLNPKIRNLTQAYKLAKHNLVWIWDLNVWVPRHTLAKLVAYLSRRLLERGRRVKLVHHTPLAVAMRPHQPGAMLDEMFLSTAHATFYNGLNVINTAPCVNGKLSMYRRSDLDASVAAATGACAPGDGLAHFARYIGEDNQIAIALWNHPAHDPGFSKLLPEAVFQPVEGRSVLSFVWRRVRWLRVRKFMVLAATLLEPTTECLLLGAMGSYAVPQLWCAREAQTYLNRAVTAEQLRYFAAHVLAWLAKDAIQWRILRTAVWWQYPDPETASTVPLWIAPPPTTPSFTWLATWALRETLALPVWTLAMCGLEVLWRGAAFSIKPHGDAAAR